jgi:two-component sensor histidine kinase
LSTTAPAISSNRPGPRSEIEGTEASIPTEQILALGLIANELVTNAKKHGAGTIKVTFRTRGRGEYELCVLDEGPGLPEGFAPDRHAPGSLGMKLVALLASQLGGRLSASANPAGRGASFSVTFAAADPAGTGPLRAPLNTWSAAPSSPP